MNNIQVDVEGTNELFTGEVFGSWTPAFLRNDGTVAVASLVAFQTPTANAGPKIFKIRVVILNGGSNQGAWTARSVLNVMNPMAGHLIASAFTNP